MIPLVPIIHSDLTTIADGADPRYTTPHERLDSKLE